MPGQRTRVIRQVTLFGCDACGDRTDLELRRGYRADHVCGWTAGATWWIHRPVAKR